MNDASNEDEMDRPSKRLKRDEPDGESQNTDVDKASADDLLPPSHALLGVTKLAASSDHRIREIDVGISEYITKDAPQIQGIIKQRFTDFLVFEIDQEGHAVHIKSLGMPESELDKPKPVTNTPKSPGIDVDSEGKLIWASSCDSQLSHYLSEEGLLSLRKLVEEGPNVPPTPDVEAQKNDREPVVNISDREADKINELVAGTSHQSDVGSRSDKQTRGARGGRSRGRGGQSRGVERPDKRVADNRRVNSKPIATKEERAAFHKLIRDLFGGRLETETVTVEGESSIAILWHHVGQGRRVNDETMDKRPPFIHFSLQKTNRDTQDAISYLARTLHMNAKDLSVAGTKDKRGVTTQRVALKRNGKTLQDIWKMANGFGRLKTMDQILMTRGDRGVRIADLVYRKASLSLGMLKGNAFVITLRNVKFDSEASLENVMNSMKSNGFINYYGMQRFGTASVPTHSIGRAILQSDWHRAVSLILRVRPGEHPDVEAARRAWLEEKDLDKALQLMPRRSIAERCLLESFQKQGGDDRNAMGALSTIPRNLRLMYIHAYQSYVWNAIVSERIRRFGFHKSIAGDLVFESDEEQEDVAMESAETLTSNTAAQTSSSSSRNPKSSSKKPWQSPRVKVLSEADKDRYSIFDVIMPLPGQDVAYPDGELGQLYKEFLRLDGLDPDNFVRKQKEYILGGSYRKMLHLPKELSWSLMRYTDPDVPLAQADEDTLLGLDRPVDVADGKFIALQIRLSLGTAAYATMALREILKQDTGSQFQSSLTLESEDQLFKGASENAGAAEKHPRAELDTV